MCKFHELLAQAPTRYHRLPPRRDCNLKRDSGYYSRTNPLPCTGKADYVGLVACSSAYAAEQRSKFDAGILHKSLAQSYAKFKQISATAVIDISLAILSSILSSS